MIFWGEIRVFGFWAGLFVLVCMGFPRSSFSILKVLSENSIGEKGHLWLQFRPNPFSVFGDQVSPHVHLEGITLIIIIREAVLGGDGP